MASLPVIVQVDAFLENVPTIVLLYSLTFVYCQLLLAKREHIVGYSPQIKK